MTAAVQGDPASCSQVGGSLRQLAARLRAAASPVATAQDELGVDWSGRVARTVGRGSRTTLEATEATATELDRTGALLQDHATDLAEAVQDARSVEQRAQAAGLAVHEGRVVPPWGVTGLADEATQATREQRRAELQAELDHVVLRLSRRRARLTSALETARAVLADHSAALRE